MRDALLRAMPRQDRQFVVFRAVFWADIVRGRQQEYLSYARTSTSFIGTPLHKLVIEGLGDAAAYQKTKFRRNSAYFEIQDRLKRTIRDAANGRDDARPLIFIGHSLGCHIISSFAWDLHKIKRPQSSSPTSVPRLESVEFPDIDPADEDFASHLHEASSFERLDTFSGFITMGSNMPLFTFTFGPHNVHPISRTPYPKTRSPAFPGPAIRHEVLAQARWLNFYSVNDPLGYPLKPLNDAYDDEPLLSDHAVSSEGLWRSIFLRGKLRQLNALRAHTGYWTNKEVIKGAARLIRDIINADEIARRVAVKTSKTSNLMGDATPQT